jgi:hypothetical protein
VEGGVSEAADAPWLSLALDQDRLMGVTRRRGSVGATVLKSPPTLADTSLAEAEKLISQTSGDYRLPVLLLQIAREQFVLLALTRRLNGMGLRSKVIETILDLIRDFDIANHERASRLYVAITEDHIKQVPWWSKLKTCVKVRNEVSHLGKFPTDQEARDALEVTKLLKDHLNAIEWQTRPPTAPGRPS